MLVIPSSIEWSPCFGVYFPQKLPVIPATKIGCVTSSESTASSSKAQFDAVISQAICCRVIDLCIFFWERLLVRLLVFSSESSFVCVISGKFFS